MWEPTADSAFERIPATCHAVFCDMADSVVYQTSVEDSEECDLLCEADEHCLSSSFKLSMCTVTSRWQPQEAMDLRRVLLVTYASGKVFEDTQRKLHESLHIGEIADHWPWNGSTFEQEPHKDWYRRHSNVNFRRGGAWKPYVIWQAFRRVKWGDWLVSWQEY